MTRVSDLQPGDKVTMPLTDLSAVFIQRAAHPIWGHLELVIWKLSTGEWSHDALNAHQEIGEVVAQSFEEKRLNLRRALLHESQV